jgi:hypothetical protein
MSRVPEKFLVLHARYSAMKSDLAKLDVTDIDTAGVLSGEGSSCVSILRDIFLSRLPPTLLGSFHISPALSDAKLAESIYRFIRAELHVNPKLTVEQFLQNGAFTQRKIELVSEIARAVGKRFEKKREENEHRPDKPPEQCLEPRPPIDESVLLSPPEPFEKVESIPVGPTLPVFSGVPTLPVFSGVPTLPVSPTVFPPSLDSKVLELCLNLSKKLEYMDSKFTSSIESLENRITIIESRIRVQEKLGVISGG